VIIFGLPLLTYRKSEIEIVNKAKNLSGIGKKYEAKETEHHKFSDR